MPGRLAQSYLQKEDVMAIDVKMIQHNNYLEFVVTGSHDMNEAIDKFAELLDACKQTGIAKVLINYTQLVYNAGGTEKALYAFGAENQYLKYLKSGGHQLQLAYLAPKIHSYEPGAEIGKKIESLQFELFDNLDKAIAWLDVNRT
jgi:hypothetical protein